MRRPRSTITSVALFLGVWALYVALPSRNYQFDGLRYSIQARDASEVADLLHPHHVLFTPLLWGVRRLLAALAPGIDPLHSVQLVIAALGAAGVVIFSHLLVRSLPRARPNAVYASLLLAVSYGYWHYSTEPEPYTAALAPALLAVIVVHRALRVPSASSAVLAAALHTLAVGLHQMHVFLGVVLVGLMLWPGDGERHERRTFTLVYLASVTVMVGGLYVGAAALAGVDPSPQALFRWATSYAHGGRWGTLASVNLFHAAGGAFTAVMAKGLAQRLLGGTEWSTATLARMVFPVAAGACVGALATVWIRNARALLRTCPFLTRYVLLSSVAYLPFLLWWEPYNPEFWIALLPTVWAAVAQLTSCAPLPWLPAGAARAVLPALIVVIGGYNLVFEIGPESRLGNNEYHRFTRQVAKHATARDLVVTPIPQVTVYGDYFFDKEFRRLALHELPAGSSDFPANLKFVHDEIDATHAGGSRVFLAEHEMDPPAANLKQLTKFSREEYARCYESYRDRLRPMFEYEWLGKSYTMFEIVPAITDER